MSLRERLNDPLPVTAPLVLNPRMARMVEATGFPAGYLGGGATGYQKVALEANLNLTEMCQAALDIRAVSSLPLILDGACGYGDPMHMHRTVGMAEAAGFEAIEIEDLLAAFAAWKKIYADLSSDFGGAQPKPDWSGVEHEMLQVIGIDKPLAVERATVEKGKP